MQAKEYDIQAIMNPLICAHLRVDSSDGNIQLSRNLYEAIDNVKVPCSRSIEHMKPIYCQDKGDKRINDISKRVSTGYTVNTCLNLILTQINWYWYRKKLYLTISLFICFCQSHKLGQGVAFFGIFNFQKQHLQWTLWVIFHFLWATAE